MPYETESKTRGSSPEIFCHWSKWAGWTLQQLWRLSDLRKGFICLWFRLWENGGKLLKLKRRWSTAVFHLSETGTMRVHHISWLSAALRPEGLLIKACFCHMRLHLCGSLHTTPVLCCSQWYNGVHFNHWQSFKQLKRSYFHAVQWILICPHCYLVPQPQTTPEILLIQFWLMIFFFTLFSHFRPDFLC